jgi:hypothetical protein
VNKVGKWPEFALEVSREMHGVFKLASKDNLPTYHLGPCRPDDFKEDVKKIIGALKGKATDTEMMTLKGLDGKWPDYPRELVKLARTYDMSLPGAMPPGPPSMWEKTYNPPRPPMTKP